MYLEVKNLTPDEAKKIKALFGDRVRLIDSIYTEVCRVEADCTLDILLDAEEVDATNIDNLDNTLDELARKIESHHGEIVFQDLCERSNEEVKNYFNQL